MGIWFVGKIGIQTFQINKNVDNVYLNILVSVWKSGLLEEEYGIWHQELWRDRDVSEIMGKIVGQNQ